MLILHEHSGPCSVSDFLCPLYCVILISLVHKEHVYISSPRDLWEAGKTSINFSSTYQMDIYQAHQATPTKQTQKKEKRWRCSWCQGCSPISFPFSAHFGHHLPFWSGVIQPRACVNAFGDSGGEDDVGADVEVVARCADSALCAVQTLIRVCALQSSTTSVWGRPGLRLQKRFSCNHCLR